MYGKVLVLLMIAFCLIEVMDNKVAPLTFQVFLKGQSVGISMALKGLFYVNSASSRSSTRRSRNSPSRYPKGESSRISPCLKGLLAGPPPPPPPEGGGPEERVGGGGGGVLGWV
jgi:hypothetical protein